MSGARKALLALGLALCAFGFRFACARVADRGRFATAYSSYGSGPKGARALYLLAQRLGAKPRRWAEDLAALPKGSGLLVALGDCETEMARVLSRYERHELERWVDQGGVVLVAGARYYLPDDFGLRFAPDAACRGERRLARMNERERGLPEPQAPSADAGTGAGAGAGGAASPDAEGDETSADESEAAQAEADATDPSVAWAVPEGEALRGLPPVPMRLPGTLSFDTGTAHETLLLRESSQDGDGGESPRVAGVAVPHGRGFAIVLASGSMFQNRALRSGDGAVLFARLLAKYGNGGPLLFDEYHLGVGERRSLVRYLREIGATPFALQLLCAVALALFRGGARFGGLREPRAHAPAGTASLVAAMGRLFARAGDARGALHVLGKQALDRVAAFHHLPPQSAHGLELALRERGLPTCADAVRQIASLEQAQLAPGGLAVASRRLDRAVEQATTASLSLPAAAGLG